MTTTRETIHHGGSESFLEKRETFTEHGWEEVEIEPNRPKTQPTNKPIYPTSPMFSDLDQSKPRLVPGSGPPNPKMILVGEAPGAQEDKILQPFVGASVAELTRILNTAGILRSELYLTNVIKERPPNNDITKFINLDRKNPFVSDEAKSYISQLFEELRSINSRVIIAMGNIALYALTGREKILRWRGSPLTNDLLPGKIIIPTIHTRACLPPSGVYLYRHLITFDLRRGLKYTTDPNKQLPSYSSITRPSHAECIHWLHYLLSNHILVDIDIETIHNEVSCFGICWYEDNTTHTLCIPFTFENGNYFTIEQEAEIWRLISQLMESPRITKRGQNILFDHFFLLHKHGIRGTNFLDTMIAQGVVYPDFPKGLDFIASIHTELPYYKDEGKQWKKLTFSYDTLWEYNCKDTVATNMAWPSLQRELENQNNLPTYRRQASLIEPLAYMQERGIRMDTSNLEEMKAIADAHIKDLTNELRAEVGFNINPNSPAQLKDYFYKELGIKPYRNRKTGADSVNEDALRRLARRGFKAASITLDIRKLVKLKGTYLEVQLDGDHRLRCSFNPVGTQTGRLSSSQTIFGTGTNLQNLPPEFRRLMLFDEGYIGYNIDLSQAENRIVAFVGPVPEMMDAFNRGLDVHSLTAAMISGLSPDEVKRQDKEGIPCPIGGGSYTWRFFGKKANHALNYGEGYRTFSLINEIPESDGLIICNGYHRAYPGVQQGFQNQVRQMLSQNRTVTNCLGRNRTFLDRWGDDLFKSAYAFIPQSTVADIINLRGIDFIWSHPSRLIHHNVELLLQIHDSIMFQIPRHIGPHLHASIIWDIKSSLETPIHWKSNEFIIPADIQLSHGSMMKGPDGLRDLPKNLRSLSELEDVIDGMFND